MCLRVRYASHSHAGDRGGRAQVLEAGDPGGLTQATWLLQAGFLICQMGTVASPHRVGHRVHRCTAQQAEHSSVPHPATPSVASAHATSLVLSLPICEWGPAWTPAGLNKAGAEARPLWPELLSALQGLAEACVRVEVPFPGGAACQVPATKGAVGHSACFLGPPPVMGHRAQGENPESPRTAEK